MEISVNDALQRAITAHQEGRPEEAERFYRAILTSHPKHPDANHNLGILMVGLGKAELALSYLKTALESKPEAGPLWISYIETLISVDQLAAARSVLSQGRNFGLKGEKTDLLEARLADIGPSVSPVVRKQETDEEVSIPITSSICFFVFSISDAGKSILLSTGIIS